MDTSKHKIDGHHTYTISGLTRKREDLIALRKKLIAEQKQVERDIVVVTKALKLFDPNTYTKQIKAEIAKKRPPIKTRRFTIEYLRTADGPMTSRQMAERYMEEHRVEPNSGNVRSFCARFASACFNLHKQGLAELVIEDGKSVGWKRAQD